jgi:pSer/pThr/pTyr-binding forkhead associated (FHA) protein
MDRVIIEHLSGSLAGRVEVYPCARFDAIRLGRDPACEVRFDPLRDDRVSRHHASIEWAEVEGGFAATLTDLPSSNGTLLNGRQVQAPAALADGDRIQLGSNGPELRIRFERRPALRDSPVTASMPRYTAGELG